MNHLVKQRLNRLIPPMTPDVTTTDHDLLWMPRLSTQSVMPKTRFHSTRNTNRNRTKLAAKFRIIQHAMRAPELTNETGVNRTPRKSTTRGTNRLEIKRKLELPSGEKFSQRSKQRCGPGTNVRLSSDQMRVVTSMVSFPIVITFTDDGRPPRERLDTVPAVEITVPFLVCSM